MTKARLMADLIDNSGDVVSGALDNVPASDDASALTSGTLAAARLPAEIVSSDASPQLAGDLDTNSNDILMGSDSLKFGTSKWELVIDGNNLVFKYNGTAKIKFVDDGEIVSVDDLTAFGTI